MPEPDPLVLTDDEAAQLIERFDPRANVIPLVTPDHITTQLEERGRENARAQERYFANQKFALAVLGSVLVFVIFLVVWLSGKQADLLKELLDKLFTLALGLFGGASGATAYWIKKKSE